MDKHGTLEQQGFCDMALAEAQICTIQAHWPVGSRSYCNYTNKQLILQANAIIVQQPISGHRWNLMFAPRGLAQSFLGKVHQAWE